MKKPGSEEPSVDDGTITIYELQKEPAYQVRHIYYFRGSLPRFHDRFYTYLQPI